MYFARKFPPIRYISKKIHFDLDCNLCLGFWTYLALAILLDINIMDGTTYSEIPIFGEVITAAFTSFVMHLVVIGWNDLFTVIEVKS